MLNFCPHCGQPWSHTKFCAHCGANLSKFIDDTPANDFTFATDSADTSVEIQGDFDIVLRELEDAAKRTRVLQVLEARPLPFVNI